MALASKQTKLLDCNVSRCRLEAWPKKNFTPTKRPGSALPQPTMASFLQRCTAHSSAALVGLTSTLLLEALVVCLSPAAADLKLFFSSSSQTSFVFWPLLHYLTKCRTVTVFLSTLMGMVSSFFCQISFVLALFSVWYQAKTCDYANNNHNISFNLRLSSSFFRVLLVF